MSDTVAHLTPEDRAALEAMMDKTTWGPERKIVAAAVATLALAIVQIVWPALDVPAGVEGAVAVIVGYFMPNRAA